MSLCARVGGAGATQDSRLWQHAQPRAYFGSYYYVLLWYYADTRRASQIRMQYALILKLVPHQRPTSASVCVCESVFQSYMPNTKIIRIYNTGAKTTPIGG